MRNRGMKHKNHLILTFSKAIFLIVVVKRCNLSSLFRASSTWTNCIRSVGITLMKVNFTHWSSLIDSVCPFFTLIKNVHVTVGYGACPPDELRQLEFERDCELHH